jgi:hypothetical protein
MIATSDIRKQEAGTDGAQRIPTSALGEAVTRSWQTPQIGMAQVIDSGWRNARRYQRHGRAHRSDRLNRYLDAGKTSNVKFTMK